MKASALQDALATETEDEDETRAGEAPPGATGDSDPTPPEGSDSPGEKKSLSDEAVVKTPAPELQAGASTSGLEGYSVDGFDTTNA